jgi:hypothetical protein
MALANVDISAPVPLLPSPQGEVSVKREKKSAAAPTPPPPASNPSLDRCKKLLLAGGAAAYLACTGAQVRPPPAPQECPPGALQAREKWRFEEQQAILRPDGKAGVFPVQEGPVEWAWDVNFEGTHKLGMGWRLKGELTIGKEYLYGRFTEAITPDKERVPVCIEITHLEGWSIKPGEEIKSREGTGVVRVYFPLQLKVVRQFR